MGQMTAGQVLAQVDDLLPNSYPGEQKRRWLRQAEGFVLEEVDVYKRQTLSPIRNMTAPPLL